MAAPGATVASARLWLRVGACCTFSTSRIVEHGHAPEPGHSLLRLARGDAQGAWTSIRRILADETIGLAARTSFLPAGIDIAVAAGELESAERYSDELDEAASSFETAALKGAAAYARGKIAFARDDADRAESCFRTARALW